MRYGWVVGAAVAAMVGAGADGALAQSGPGADKDEFCREMLDLTGDLLTGSALVMVATGMQEFEETGEAASSDPEVNAAIGALSDATGAVAEQVLDYCRE